MYLFFRQVLVSGDKRHYDCNTYAYQRVTNPRNIAKAACAVGLPCIVKYTTIDNQFGGVIMISSHVSLR